MMIVVMICNFMVNRYIFFDRVINLVDEIIFIFRKDVLYILLLVVFFGVLFYILMYDQCYFFILGISNLLVLLYNIVEYVIDFVWRNLYLWMKNFFRFVLGIKVLKMNIKVYGLVGKYKLNFMFLCEGFGNLLDIKEMMKGLRFINFDIMI